MACGSVFNHKVELICIGCSFNNFRVSGMKNTKIAERDFSEWAEAAERDPAAFEQMRLAAIEDYINSVPEESRERLRRLQWRIDQERRLGRTPMGACIRLSRMMWKNVLGDGGLRERFQELGQLLGATRKASPEAAVPTDGRGAQVLAFVRAQER